MKCKGTVLQQRCLFAGSPGMAYSNRCKSVKCPDSGKLTANGKGVHREVESEGGRMANLWSDGQKSHIRLGISGKTARQVEAQ